jgi:hypothetical protein
MSRQQGNIAGVYDPDVVLTQKGALIGHDGTDPVEIPPAANGRALVYDDTQPSGIGSRVLDQASLNVTNAANRYLYDLGM